MTTITVTEAYGKDLEQARAQVLIADVQQTLRTEYKIFNTTVTVEVGERVYPQSHSPITVIAVDRGGREHRHLKHPRNTAEDVAYFLKCSIVAVNVAVALGKSVA